MTEILWNVPPEIRQSYQFRLDFEVRDYECDLEGIVNNAQYMHYLEHARHRFLLHIGVDFAEQVKRGVYVTMVRAELDYLSPLFSRDRFYVGVNMLRLSRLRIGFLQGVYRLPDNKPVLAARIVGAIMNGDGRPIMPPDLEMALENYSVHKFYQRN